MNGTEIASRPSTTSAWVWAVICGLYAISPIDLIPDVIPVVGWADDALAVVGGGLNLIQATVAQSSETLARILKIHQMGSNCSWWHPCGHHCSSGCIRI